MNWKGDVFLLTLSEETSAEHVVDVARGILGEGTRRLRAEAEAEAIAALGRGEPWLRADETMRLSRREAEVLASGFVDAVVSEFGLADDQGLRLNTLLEQEITAAFERIHASPEGLATRWLAESRIVIDRVSKRSREFLSEDQARLVTERLESFCESPATECGEAGAGAAGCCEDERS